MYNYDRYLATEPYFVAARTFPKYYIEILR